MHDTTIVIPTCDFDGQFIIPCLDSLEKTIDENIQIIIVANGTSSDIYNWIPTSLLKRTRIIWNENKLGFAKATNLGIKECKTEYIVLLNDDVCFTQLNWIETLKLNLTDEVVIVGPHVYEHGWWVNNIEIGSFTTIGFWCAMMKKDLFDKLGLIDETFGLGGSEDSDYSIRIYLAGYRSLMVPIYGISHIETASFKKIYGIDEATSIYTSSTHSLWYKWNAIFARFDKIIHK